MTTTTTAANPVCILDDKGYCVRHKRRHMGAALKHALDPGRVGCHHREQWDLQLAMREANRETGATTDAIAALIHERQTSGDKKTVIVNKRTAIPLVRVDQCEHFTGRLERRHGCGGMKCRGGCTKELPAVPGVFCQTCESYAADDGVPWLS